LRQALKGTRTESEDAASRDEEENERRIESYREATHEIQAMMTDHLEFASVAAAEERQIAIDKEDAIRVAAAKTAQTRQQLVRDTLSFVSDIANSMQGIWQNFFTWQSGQEDLSDKERRKIQRDAAIANKAFATFQVILATAMSIQAALTSFPPNVPLAIMNAISGAAQLAKVLSTPIPALAKGGITQGEQVARIGEAGPEMIMPLTDEVFARLAEAIEDARVPSIQNVLADERPINLSVMIPDLGKTLNAHITKASRLGHILIDNKRGITR